MKFVKVYNAEMQCVGVADIEQNYDKTGYVKLFDKTDMHCLGVVDVDNIPESGENMPVVQVFDENMMPVGVVTADNIRHSDGYLITLQKDPSTTGSVSGGGRFVAGTSVTVVATPDSQSDYSEFDGWYEGQTKVSENASYTFTVSGARTLVAKFKIGIQGIASIEPQLPWNRHAGVITMKMGTTKSEVIDHLELKNGEMTFSCVEDNVGLFITEGNYVVSRVGINDKVITLTEGSVEPMPGFTQITWLKDLQPSDFQTGGGFLALKGSVFGQSNYKIIASEGKSYIIAGVGNGNLGGGASLVSTPQEVPDDYIYVTTISSNSGAISADDTTFDVTIEVDGYKPLTLHYVNGTCDWFNS